MCCYKARELCQRSVKRRQDKGEREHRPREPGNIEANDEERHLLALVVLGKCIGEGQYQGYNKSVSAVRYPS